MNPSQSLGLATMDYPLKVRIEIGPGIPSSLSRVSESDARKAVLKAVFEQLLLDKWPAGFIAKGMHGSTTACLFATRTHHASEPPGGIPTTHIDEYEFVVELEGPEETEFRNSQIEVGTVSTGVNDLGVDRPQPVRS